MSTTATAKTRRAAAAFPMLPSQPDPIPGTRIRWDGDMANAEAEGMVLACSGGQMTVKWDDGRQTVTMAALLSGPRWHVLPAAAPAPAVEPDPIEAQLFALSQDEGKIAAVLNALRDLKFAALSPAGRAECGTALAALYRAEEECAEQRRRIRAAR